MRCAVLGDPIDHSLSPVIHRAAYEALGLDGWQYDAVQVPSGGLAGVRRRARPRDVARAVADHAAQARGGAAAGLLRRVGGARPVPATRCCSTPDGRRHGLNTDVTGALMVLGEHDEGPIERAVVLGGGATATSMLLALAERGMRHATLVVRDPDRAAETVHAVRGAPLGARRWRCARSARSTALAGDVLVSTVPASAQVPDLVAAVAGVPLVFDVVYEPWPTPLAAAAAAGRPDRAQRPRPAGRAGGQPGGGDDRTLRRAGRRDAPRRRGRAGGEAAR